MVWDTSIWAIAQSDSQNNTGYAIALGCMLEFYGKTLKTVDTGHREIKLNPRWKLHQPTPLLSQCMGTVTGYNTAQSLLQMTPMVLRRFIQNHRGDNRIFSNLIPTKKLFWFLVHKWWGWRQIPLTTQGHGEVKGRGCWNPRRSRSSRSVQTLGHHSAVWWKAVKKERLE